MGTNLFDLFDKLAKNKRDSHVCTFKNGMTFTVNKVKSGNNKDKFEVVKDLRTRPKTERQLAKEKKDKEDK